jgi:rifampicin phosphotransferase
MHPPGSDKLVEVRADHPTSVGTVGAKAHSLQRVSACGLRVPPAHVITSSFFEPWLRLILRSPAWMAIQQATREQWPLHCVTLRRQALELPLSVEQRLTLWNLYARLARNHPSQRYAVRSSSPEEDTDAASFAGLYATELGISTTGLEGAVRRCFASVLDNRVLAYKAARGLDADRPSLAVIIQEQIDSEVAGVGFSINPASNDFDETVIEANWGLGESVVSGSASPDCFVIDKYSSVPIERRLGAKQISVRVAPDEGTLAVAHPKRNQLCLDDAQLQELNTAICRLEKMYGCPVDMEWAYAKGQLYVLQARPITAYIPLPVDMQTAPGEKRILYMDIALSKGITSNAPISPMGLDWLAGDIACMLSHSLGRHAIGVKSPDGLLYLGGSRMYLNLSKMLWFSSPAQLAKANAPTDQRMADILAGIDTKRYRSARRPAWIGPALRAFPIALWRLRHALWRTVRSVLAPQSTHQLYQRERQRFEHNSTRVIDARLSLSDFQRFHARPAIAHIVNSDLPALGVGVMGIGAVKRLARTRSEEEQQFAEQLSRGVEGNLIVDMGIRIFQMAKMLDAVLFDDLDALCARVQHRQLPAKFLHAWDSFMARYGCRGPGEMDIANPRYADDPRLVLHQMSSLAAGTATFDPAAAHRALSDQREGAYTALLQRFGWTRRMLLARANQLIVLFGGTRDTPKQHNLLYQHAARERLLLEGRTLVAADRLDTPEQVFDLVLADLDAAAQDKDLDLRARALERTHFARTLKTHVRAFPAVIDSRGRILRPAARIEKAGEITGLAVSPGIAIGRVKVLSNAHEQTVSPGEILVAFTTDPGWTPLFINAAAVVLEIGGLLQHGAVVAREYGKPCVAGITDVLSRLQDGQLVEVDGTAGIVRLIPDGPA